MMVLGKVAVKKVHSGPGIEVSSGSIVFVAERSEQGRRRVFLSIAGRFVEERKKREKDQEGDVQFWFCSLAENLVGPACHVTYPVMQLELLRIRQELILAGIERLRCVIRWC
jgi:hypothetical protein